MQASNGRANSFTTPTPRNFASKLDPTHAPIYRTRNLLLALSIGFFGILGGLWFYANAPSYCWKDPAACVRIAYYKYALPVLPSQTDGSTTLLPERSTDAKPFYGMQYVPEADMATVAELGVNTILHDFRFNGTPEEWIELLDTAAGHGFKVVAWLWPNGWQWNAETGQWTIDPQARLFVETVVDHPALLAVYGTHEGYWQGGYGNGYTTAQLQTLYRQIKEIADVPIYSAFGDFAFWRYYSPETVFADGVCDYCDVQYYPVLDSGYDIEEYVDRLALELSTVRELAPNSKFVWVMQAFESELSGRVMPSADQMREIASIALETDVDGVWWYVWNFDTNQYEDFLGKHPELYPVVREIYEEYIYVEATATVAPTATATVIAPPTATAEPTTSTSPPSDTAPLKDAARTYLPMLTR